MKSPLRSILAGIAVLVALGSGQSAMAAFDAFLKIEGIDGESVNPRHPKEIVVLSFTQGVSSPTATTGGGGAAGRAIFSALTVAKPLDKATPLLYQNCAAATPIASAVLTLRQAAGDQNEIYRITLSDVVIAGVQTGGAVGADLATESITLSFSRIEWRYIPYDATGKPGTPVVGSWNIPANTP